MAKSNKTKAAEPKSNSALLIIGGVLVLAALGGWYLYASRSAAPAKNTNRSTANTAKTPPPNAPAGAQPPNQAGSPTAAVTVEEFADFQCGSCALANPILNEIKSMYGSRIRFIFRHYPLSMHDKAYDAAVAAEAAGLQGKFWEMQNQLFTNQQTWSPQSVPLTQARQMWRDYATKVGLDVNRWETDMAGIQAKSRVDQDLARGRAMGVSATPTLYINNQPVPFTEMKVQSLKAIIDGELQKAQAQPAQGAPAANQTR
jgi:protein-disulfide isomerase